MTALREIQAAIALHQRSKNGLFKAVHRLVVYVGISAKQAIEAETTNRCLPNLLDGALIRETSEFPGWAVIWEGLDGGEASRH